MDRSSIVLSVALAFVGSALAAHAGPCTTQISQLEAQIQSAQAQPPGSVGSPSAPQSVFAQLHRQPTAQSVESRANADGEAAVERAKKADAAGNASECATAIVEAREFYGLE